jgi:phosphatidylglycerophosphatase GEP4
MVQSLNTKAMYTFATVVLRRPNLMIPHVSVATISDIDFVSLKQYTDIRAVIFDKDHTITSPYANNIQNVAILSNSAGTNDDTDYKDAIQMESSLGIPVIRHVAKKPGGIEEVMHHFSETVSHPTQLCIVGDRVLTDIVFGNLHNMFTIHTAAFPPSDNHKDNWTAQLFRPMENKVIYRSNVFGMKRKFFSTPIPHPAYNHIVEKQQSFVLSSSSYQPKSAKE